MFTRLLNIIKRVKVGVDGVEVEFKEKVGIDSTATKLQLSICVTKDAIADIKRYKIKDERVCSYLKGVLERHQLLLESAFHSMPFYMGDFIVLVSFTKNCRITVERVISVKERSAHLNHWAVLLSEYRKVASLPYRIGSKDCLIQDSMAKRTIAAFQRLANLCADYAVYCQNITNLVVSWESQACQHLLVEAEDALVSQNIGACISRLEVILSNCHQLLLGCTPSDTVQQIVSALSADEFHYIPAEAKNIVLLVEDEKEVRKLIRKILERLGYEVVEAEGAMGALKYLLTKKFLFIVSDLILPGSMSGVEIIRLGSLLQSFKGSVVVSGYNDAMEACKNDANLILAKPLSPAEFKKVIEKIADMIKNLDKNNMGR